MINRNNISNDNDGEGNWSILHAKVYFDIYSHEFRSLELQEKLNNLGFLIAEGMELPEVIMHYCDNRSSHIVDAVKPTLLYYIQQMRWGESPHFTGKILSDMTEIEIAMLMQDEIKVRYALSEVNCSNWDESIVNEIAKRAGNDKAKFADILRNAEFSREYQNRNRV